MNELQARSDLAFPVFPQAPTFLQPSEGTLHHPSLWNDGKRVQFAAFGHLHARSQKIFNRIGKRRVGVAAIDQNIDHCRQIFLVSIKHCPCARAIRHPGGYHVNGMWQALRIDGDMALVPETFLPAS